MKLNQIKMGIVLSYITTFLNMVVQLVYMPIMLRLLGQSEYGLYTLVGSFVSYLSLFSLGFTGSYLRFYSRYKVKNDKNSIAKLNGMFLLLFCLMSLMALISGMILSQYTDVIFGSGLSHEELIKSKKLMQILVINIALTFPAAVFDSIVSANEKFIFQRMITLLGIVFNPFICLPLLLMGYKSVAVVIVTTTITFIKLIINIWFCLKKLNTKFLFNNLDFHLLKEIGAFSFFLFINMLIDQINWSVDKLILGRISGSIAVAIYGVGSQINNLFINFSSTISSVFSARVNMIVAEDTGDTNDRLTRLFIKVGRIQYIILGLIYTGFVFFGYYFITNIYATNEYAEAYSVALWLILPAFIPLIQNLGIEIQRAMNKHQFRSIIYLVMAIINIFISIPLAKKYGAVGSAVGTGISLIIANGLIMNLFYYNVIGLNIPLFWKNIISITKGFIMPIIIGIIMNHYLNISNVFNFIICILVYTIVYIANVWLFSMNIEEKNMIRNIRKRLIKKYD